MDSEGEATTCQVVRGIGLHHLCNWWDSFDGDRLSATASVARVPGGRATRVARVSLSSRSRKCSLSGSSAALATSGSCGLISQVLPAPPSKNDGFLICQICDGTYTPEGMAENEGKKRKRHSNGIDKPSKKVAFDHGDSPRFKVTYNGETGPGPVLVSSPGLTTPDLLFNAYAKTGSTSRPNDHATPTLRDLLLHSQKHPRLDYTASPVTVDQGLSHYVAVYDPATKQIEITPAHHLSLRSSLRTEGITHQQRSNLQQRQELGREFGTKKAKKIIADKTVNAITSQAPKNKGQPDAVQDAVLKSMPDTITDAPTEEQAKESALASKPIPKPNLGAESVEDVYTFNLLLPPADAKLVNIREWQEKVSTGQKIIYDHRFPAHRVPDLAATDQVLRLKALKYLQLLLEFHDALPSGGRNGKKVPKKDVLDKRLAAWPETLVYSVRRRFATESNELTKWHMQNLYTHMCALSLYVDGWTTDTSNLRDDLKVDTKEIVQYFRELGCKIAAPTEAEKERFKVKKGQERNVKVAKLRLPLEFPKARSAVRR